MPKKFLLLVLILGICACSSKPSANDVASQLNTMVSKYGVEKFISIENVKKQNGFQKDQKTYIEDVSYDIVFKSSLEDVFKDMVASSGEDFTNGFTHVGLNMQFGLMGLKMQYGDIKEGMRVPLQKKVTLIKTENGWEISDMQ